MAKVPAPISDAVRRILKWTAWKTDRVMRDSTRRRATMILVVLLLVTTVTLVTPPITASATTMEAIVGIAWAATAIAFVLFLWILIREHEPPPPPPPPPDWRSMAVMAAFTAALTAALSATVAIRLAIPWRCLSCGERSSPHAQVRLRIDAVRLQLDCGRPLRHVGPFWTLEPPSPHPARKPLQPVAGDDPIQNVPEARRIPNVVTELRASAHGRSLDALILIGSTDMRGLHEQEVDQPHRDNTDLAERRAQWVEDQLSDEFAPSTPQIFILNSEELRLAQLVIGDSRNPRLIDDPDARKVYVCALWRPQERRDDR